MPRIPRLGSDEPDGPSPEAQTPPVAPDGALQDPATTPNVASGDAPTTQLPTLSGGDPLAATAPKTFAPVPEAAPAPAPDVAPTTEAPALPGPGVPSDGVPTAGATVAPEPPAEPPVAAPSAGFAERTRMRRRLRYLRRLRELAFRDLGGLVFDLHRFARQRDDLVTAKLDGLTSIDVELRALETALGDRRPLHELREPGIAACPRCATLHGSDANFCPGCGTPLRGSVVRSAGAVTIASAEAPADAGPTPRDDEPPAPAAPTP